MTISSRKLAAVLVADVVGYSRLMGEDETRTLKALRELRTESFEPVITAQQGQVVKRMGDGWLVEFASIVDAVHCAIEIQESLNAHEFIKLRIGIHIGDIVHEDEDIYGDGVNIAARLQEKSPPGGIAISAFAYDSLDGVNRSLFQNLGAAELKNIAQKIEIYGWSSKPMEPVRQAGTADRPSIMVLPFAIAGGTADSEMLAEGLTDAVITALSRFSWFITLPRNSSFQYKGQSVDIAKIQREHKLSYILEGNLRTAGNRARISAELVDAKTGSTIWSDRFDGDVEDPFEFEDRITRSILGELTPRFFGAETRRVRSGGDGGAWDLMMQGRSLLWRVNEADILRAQELFRRAIELAPDSGLGHSDLAWSYVYQRIYGWGGDFEEVNLNAIASAEKALAADDLDAYALAAASAARCLTAESSHATALARRAIDLNYNLAAAHTMLSLALFQTAAYEKAITHVEIAFELSPRDPLRPLMMSTKGILLLMLGRHDEFLANGENMARDYPGMPTGWRHLAAGYALTDQLENAENVVNTKILQLLPDHRATDAGRQVPFGKNEQARQRFIDALVKAGLPL